MTKIEKQLTKLYQLVWQYNLSEDAKVEAAKLQLLYSCGRLNELQVCYRFCLILTNQIDQIYTEKQNHIVLDILQ